MFCTYFYLSISQTLDAPLNCYTLYSIKEYKGILGQVTSPLIFFALALLVIEGIKRKWIKMNKER